MALMAYPVETMSAIIKIGFLFGKKAPLVSRDLLPEQV